PLQTRLLVPPEEPKTEPRPDFLVGEEKRHALASSKVLLNVHRQDVPFFEWLRVLEAIANGCVVVSEHSLDTAPLVPGEHFVSGRPEHLAQPAAALVRDEPELRRLRHAAYECIRRERPMSAAAERLLALAERVASRTAAGKRARAETLPARVRVGGALALENGLVSLVRSVRAPLKRALLDDAEVRALLEGQAYANFQIRRMAPALKRVVLDQLVLRRALADRGVGPDAVVDVARTPAFDRADARVSVLVPLYNHAGEVVDALRSAAFSDYDDLEIVVLDDGSTDGSEQVVRAFFEEHPYVPARLLRHEVNRGLGRTRNDLLRAARGELAFLLDADNEVYPPAISRLVAALDADPEAVFAYAMSERHAAGESLGLLTHLPWEPERLREDNYIDAMSLVRRAEILDLGAFTEDIRLYGWEDYDLWCRCAAHGRRGVLVPQILFRYRESPGSMISVTDIDDHEMRRLVKARYPALMRGETQSR